MVCPFSFPDNKFLRYPARRASQGRSNVAIGVDLLLDRFDDKPQMHNDGPTQRSRQGSAASRTPEGLKDDPPGAAAPGIVEAVGCHTFQVTGITAYLADGGALDHVQEMAAHENSRTTKLHDQTRELLTQDEVERIRL
jgi:hypothetical protein